MRHNLLVFIGVVLLIGIRSTNVMAQGMRMSPEDRAKVLKDSLGLSDKQMELVLDLLKEMGSERRALPGRISSQAVTEVE